MSRPIVIVGAGMGGLTAAIRLARRGLFHVRVLEARSRAGGLASHVELDGLVFDAGPYILLDRPGLEWAFRTLDLELPEHVALKSIEEVYEVSSSGAPPIRFSRSLEQTADGFEQHWPGSGGRYVRFIEATAKVYHRLQPLQRVSRPGLSALLHSGAWRALPFLMRPLGSVLARAGLPEPLVNAVGIWTHVAGQQLAAAPSPLACVAAVIHKIGAYYAAGGVGAIPRVLARAAEAVGVEFQYGAKVRSIRCERGRVQGVETVDGQFVKADAVVSNYNAVGTYLELVDETPARVRKRLKKLPLQSPGVCAYLAVKGAPQPPYLRFHLADSDAGGGRCRLLATPAVVEPDLQSNGWRPARLIAPMAYELAERGGESGQREFLQGVLAESWWRPEVGEFRVLSTRTPSQWGAEHHLFRDSMNPVMTARLMRTGRLGHRSPHVRGLYLAGGSTHPGQWVSFCAISGILAADLLAEDFR